MLQADDGFASLVLLLNSAAMMF